MKFSRRYLLGGCGAVFVSLGGCVSLGVKSRSDTTTIPMQDYSDTISVTKTIEREEIEYLPENDSVRYVARSRGVNRDEDASLERESVYETIPFEEWAETECAHVGAKAVSSAMKRRLGTADGLVAGVTHENGRRIISLDHQTMLDRDGDVVTKPSVTYERVKRAAPTRVRATISLAGRKHTAMVPVKTGKTTIQWM